MKKKVTALVVTYNSGKLLRPLANTLNGLEPLCRAVISDNGSSDGTPEAMKKLLPWAEILKNPVNGGFGYGNNRALERVETPYVLFLNSDASIDIDGLNRLLELLESQPGAAGVQPLIRLWDWPLVTLSAGSSMNRFGRGWDFDFMHFQPRPKRRIAKVPCITAAVSVFRTGPLRELGGFDERIFMYFEDVDLCLRMRKAGYSFFTAGEVSARHMMGASSSRSRAREWELISSAFLTRKYLGGSECRLPAYWWKREWRLRLYGLFRGVKWLWRIPAVRRARNIHLLSEEPDPEIMAEILAPRPLRMSNPRVPEERGRYLKGSSMMKGPGWMGDRTGKCGFGCIRVPKEEGLVRLVLRSVALTGSASLWSVNGLLDRTLAGAGNIFELTAEVPGGTTGLYIVPDRFEQELEVLNAEYS